MKKFDAKQYAKEYREKTKDRRKEYGKEYREKHRNETKEYNKKYRENNKEKREKYRKVNEKRIKETNKIYNDKNKEKHHIYYLEHKDKILKYQRELKKKKLASDPLYKLKHQFSKLLLMSFKRQGYTKKSRTYEILGCTFQEFKEHLEKQFEPWMNWENKGLYNGTFNYGWDIDHIVSQSNATTEEEFIKLNHYTNLQPLCGKVNRDIKKNH